MSAITQNDVQVELTELEVEEARIMRELREMDEKAHSASMAARSKLDAVKSDPRGTLNSVLLECEREVRNAMGYIASTGPPLQIARCRRGDPVPKHATFLSKPKGTGVDFTVPVSLKEYNDAIKSPIFLNDIRDKCRSGAYTSSEQYLDDMRLLEKNTASFNKGQELAWVVQHARLLLEAAEDAVASRRIVLAEAEEGLRHSGSRQISGGKRKRGTAHDANGDAYRSLSIGSVIQIFWDSDRKWYSAKVIGKGPGSQVHVEYENDGSEWLDLRHEVKWRLPPASSTGRSKRIADNASNKRKKAAANIPASPAAPTMPEPPAPTVPSVSTAELFAIRDEMLNAIDDLKRSILQSVQDRFLRVEHVLNRSDALHRVLLAVQDVQSATETSLEALQTSFTDLRSSVDAISENVVKMRELQATQTAAGAVSRGGLDPADPRKAAVNGGDPSTAGKQTTAAHPQDPQSNEDFTTFAGKAPVPSQESLKNDDEEQTAITVSGAKDGAAGPDRIEEDAGEENSVIAVEDEPKDSSAEGEDAAPDKRDNVVAASESVEARQAEEDEVQQPAEGTKDDDEPGHGDNERRAKPTVVGKPRGKPGDEHQAGNVEEMDGSKRTDETKDDTLAGKENPPQGPQRMGDGATEDNTAERKTILPEDQSRKGKVVRSSRQLSSSIPSPVVATATPTIPHAPSHGQPTALSADARTSDSQGDQALETKAGEERKTGEQVQAGDINEKEAEAVDKAEAAALKQVDMDASAEASAVDSGALESPDKAAADTDNVDEKEEMVYTTEGNASAGEKEPSGDANKTNPTKGDVDDGGEDRMDVSPKKDSEEEAEDAMSE